MVGQDVAVFIAIKLATFHRHPFNFMNLPNTEACLLS